MAHLPYLKEHSAPIADPALKREINHVLQKGFYLLRFPAFMEQHFRESYRWLAIANVRAYSAFVMIVFTLFGVFAYASYPFAKTGVILPSYLTAGLCLAALVTLSRIRKLNPHFHWYTGPLAAIGLAAIMHIPPTVSDPEMRALAYGIAIDGIIVVYAMSKMRFYNAVIWCHLSGILHLVALKLHGIDESWFSFLSYFVSSNLVGMGISYIIEHRERTMFLQSLLLDIDNKERELLYRDLEKLSREDALTGLANRRHFDECLRQEWSRCQREKKPLSLVLLDVDFFKQYNDFYGHQAGDHCLTEIARTLRKEAARPAELVGRYGGEEFILLYPNTNEQQIKINLKRIQERLAKLAIPHEGSRVAKVVTVSLGAATVMPVKSLNPEKLVSLADEMLYQSKTEGRNRWNHAPLLYCKPSNVVGLHGGER